jgi:protein TonB
MTPPREIPKEIPKVDPIPMTKNLPVVETPVVEETSSGGMDQGPGDAVNGVVGGVQGGVAGGVVGGEVGGVVGGQIGGVVGGEIGGVLGGKIGGTGTGTEGDGTGGKEAPVAPAPPPPPPPPPPSGPLRVGGDVKAPVVVDRAEPQYTESARKARVAGIVVVEAIIGKDGRVQDVKVVKGLPMGLSAEAEAAVRRWRFKPGSLNGQPVATIFNLTVNFKLD